MFPYPECHPISSCPDHYGDMDHRERVQDYFLHLLPGVLLPRLDADLQPRPHWCWKNIIPTAAEHTAVGQGVVQLGALQAGFSSPEEPATWESGVTSFIYTR